MELDYRVITPDKGLTNARDGKLFSQSRAVAVVLREARCAHDQELPGLNLFFKVFVGMSGHLNGKET